MCHNYEKCHDNFAQNKIKIGAMKTYYKMVFDVLRCNMLYKKKLFIIFIFLSIRLQ